MLQSLMIGAAAGPRAITPLAAVSAAAALGRLGRKDGVAALLARPVVAIGLAGLAASEIWGDKLRSAPDRIVAPGMAGRIVSGAVSGAALAPEGRARLGALLGVTGAVAIAYLSFAARTRAMRRFGRKRTGAIEDAMTIVLAAATVALATRRPS